LAKFTAVMEITSSEGLAVSILREYHRERIGTPELLKCISEVWSAEWKLLVM
jgi:hypothetical protein